MGIQQKAGPACLAGLVDLNAVFCQVKNTLKPAATANGPCERAGGDVQFILKLLQQLERVFALPVEFIDKDHHRCSPHPAHFHQLAGLLLNTLHTVNHQYDTVNSREGAIGVFCKILMARGVQDVDPFPLIIEGHHGCSHGNPPLLFYLQEIGSGGFSDLVALNGTGHLNRSPEH